MRILMLAIMFVFISLTALAAPSDEQIKKLLVQQSVTNYLSNIGNCPCPYNRDKAGRLCEKRSAWSKSGGNTPFCYPSDIEHSSVLEYRHKFLTGGGDEGPLKQQ